MQLISSTSTIWLAACALATIPAFFAAAQTTVPSNPLTMDSKASSISVSLDPLHPGAAIAEDFVGLSYEAQQLLPHADGSHYFSPDNKALIQVFKTIGVKNLRIGGNSVDKPVTGVPTEADIDSLFQFARAAGVKVIYSVRLQDGDPQVAAKVAKHIHDRYADTLEYFAIGNEPSYLKPYARYRDKWKEMLDAMLAVAPDAKFCGPDTNPDPAWSKSLLDDFGNPGPLAMLTVHNYPGGCAYSNPGVKDVNDLIPNDPVAAREHMLSADWYKVYEKVRKGMADTVAGTSMPFRMTETNNLWYGGLQGASDTYASALWSIDYLYWWASHGAAGLNFHTGDRAGGGKTSLECRYSAFTTADPGYDVRPLSYGMKLFSLGAQGKLIPATIDSPVVKELNVYATLSDDKTICVTSINKSHGPAAKDLKLTLNLPAPSRVAEAQVIFLSAPGADVAATTGLTIGGESIRPDGAWAGNWQPLPVPASGNAIELTLPAASAAVVKIHLR